MSVPDFQSLMLPLVRLASDNQEHTTREAINHVASLFQLSEQDQKELLPSGRQRRLDNRVGWALTHLRKAKVLEKAGRGRFCITERGHNLLQSNPDQINLNLLDQFPEHVEFRSPSDSDDQPNVSETVEDTGQTPEEILESSYQRLRRELAQELLQMVMQSSPQFFEELVVDLLVAMGYGGSRKDAGQAIGRTDDGGIDGIIKEDKLGLDVICVQAKRWEGSVGRPVVQAFAGSLMGASARKGVMITTSTFTRTARDYAGGIQQPKIVLVDGEELAQLMIDHNIGVAVQETYVLKKVDQDYFGFNEL